MGDGTKLLLGGAMLLFVLALLGQLSQIHSDAGGRVFVWPRFRHGYEVQHATRLACVPWYLALCLLALNGVVILLFGEDLRGQPAGGYGVWLVATLIPVGMAHLIDYRRSRLAALLSFLLLLAAIAGLILLVQTWWPMLLAFPLLLWSLNGVRATFADRTLG